MRYAVVADIHANLQAWRAVLADIAVMRADRVVCLGDTVGYGPEPAAVLEEVYARVHDFALGNHDAAVSGKLGTAAFNDLARRSVEWTRRQLGGKATEFLGSQPLVLKGPGFRCAHASLATPARFPYVIEAGDSVACFNACTEPLAFVGHSHVPAIFVTGSSGAAYRLEAQDFALEPGKRYVVSVGAVGQPRDADPRACYCLYDTDRGDVFFRRVAFDLEAYRQALRRAGLSEASSYFLQVAAQHELPPLREVLGFRPEAAGGPEVDAAYTVKSIEVAVRSVRRWRRLAAALALLIALGAAAGGLWYQRVRPRQVTHPALDTATAAAPAPGGDVLAPPAASGPVTAAHRLRQWTVALADPARQGVRAEPIPVSGRGDPEPGFVLASAEPLPMSLTSQAVSVQPGMAFEAGARLRKDAWRRGTLELTLVHVGPDGTETVVGRSERLAAAPPGKWVEAETVLSRKRSETLPAGGLRLRLQGAFAGEVAVRRCSLRRRE